MSNCWPDTIYGDPLLHQPNKINADANVKLFFNPHNSFLVWPQNSAMLMKAQVNMLPFDRSENHFISCACITKKLLGDLSIGSKLNFYIWNWMLFSFNPLVDCKNNINRGRSCYLQRYSIYATAPTIPAHFFFAPVLYSYKNKFIRINLWPECIVLPKHEIN